MIERTKVLCLCLLVSLLAGCGAPMATLDLMTVARQGLGSAEEAQIQQHEELLRQLKGQLAALDVAFDADVKLVGAGKIENASGQPVELTPQWVISARKGYTAARNLIGEKIRLTEAVHATRLDNIRAADEALEMASQLVVQQSSLGRRIKQQLITIQRRLVHGR